MTFVKVVEGSEIYNFSIYHFVHFYSNFLRKTRSNIGTPTCFAPHRNVAHRAHARRAVTPARAPTRSIPRQRPEAACPEAPAPRVTWRRARGTSACDGRAKHAPVCAAGVPAAYKGSAALCFACRAVCHPCTQPHPATRPELPTGASRGRRGEPRSRRTALPNCGILHLP
jgi:hypothetical protein